MSQISPSQVALSVVFSTRNRSRLLRQTLQRLSEQNLGTLPWELIVVDNGSTDDTPRILNEAKEKLPIKILHEPISGKSRALNRALECVRGELVVFTDDDIYPDPDWLKEMVEGANRWPTINVFGGRITLKFEKPPPSWLTDSLIYITAFAPFDPLMEEGTIPAMAKPWGPNYAVRFKAIGELRFCETIGPQPGDYAMGAESYFLEYLKRRGGQAIVYLPKATVSHHVAANSVSLKWLLQRAKRDGRGLYRVAAELGQVREAADLVEALKARVRQGFLCSLRGGGLKALTGALFDWQRLRGVRMEVRRAKKQRYSCAATDLTTYFDELLPRRFRDISSLGWNYKTKIIFVTLGRPDICWTIDTSTATPTCVRGQGKGAVLGIFLDSFALQKLQKVKSPRQFLCEIWILFYLGRLNIEEDCCSPIRDQAWEIAYRIVTGA